MRTLGRPYVTAVCLALLSATAGPSVGAIEVGAHDDLLAPPPSSEAASYIFLPDEEVNTDYSAFPVAVVSNIPVNQYGADYGMDSEDVDLSYAIDSGASGLHAKFVWGWNPLALTSSPFSYLQEYSLTLSLKHPALTVYCVDRVGGLCTETSADPKPLAAAATQDGVASTSPSSPPVGNIGGSAILAPPLLVSTPPAAADSAAQSALKCSQGLCSVISVLAAQTGWPPGLLALALENLSASTNDQMWSADNQLSPPVDPSPPPVDPSPPPVDPSPPPVDPSPPTIESRAAPPDILFPSPEPPLTSYQGGPVQEPSQPSIPVSAPVIPLIDGDGTSTNSPSPVELPYIDSNSLLAAPELSTNAMAIIASIILLFLRRNESFSSRSASRNALNKPNSRHCELLR